MYIHGLGYTKQYKTWIRIKNKCYNPKSSDYDRYGARGIGLHDSWMNNPVAFCDYIMNLPNAFKKGYSLDRINTYKDYEPDNLRWATRITQSRNRRIQKNNKTGYAGVFFKNDKYYSQIKINRKNKHLGAFNLAMDAAKARDRFIIDNNLQGYPLQILIRP